jgi:hypothetical protein
MRSGYQPVIIIGAGRSGTNMLRDTLIKVPTFGTWPCDEINYIWIHGNLNWPTDEFKEDHATRKVVEYIRGAFRRLAAKYSLGYVVEKTCANSLRIKFIDRIFPDARFVFIYRDPRDVVASAMKRWTAPLDFSYIFRKARFVPPSDVPYHAYRFLVNRMHKVFSRESKLSFWGPRFEGMEQMARERTLVEICAFQWAKCVTKSLDDLDQMETERVYRVKYEDFVSNPILHLLALADFLNIRVRSYEVQQYARGVSVKSVGNWKNDLNEETLKKIAPIIRDPMMRLGYLS